MGCSICIHELKSGFFFCYFVLINLLFFLKAFIYTDMQDNCLNSTVFLLPFVVDCGLVTRNRESCYRPSEYLMQLRDEHNARPHYRWREWGRGEEGV